MIYRPYSTSQSNSSASACACRWSILTTQINCPDLYLRHKYQANPMKNNEVIVQWNLHTEITHLHTRTCMHVSAGYFYHADQLGTSISIYHINLNEFEQRIKKLVLHVFVCKISNAPARECMHFQGKNTIVPSIYKC
jgi:hypothetical protein